MNNNTIFYFSLINVKKDNVTVERIELYNNNFDRLRKFKLNNGILNSLLNDKKTYSLVGITGSNLTV